MAVQTFDALASERGDSGKIWASVLKNAIKRRKPDFSESYYGFRASAICSRRLQARGLLKFGRDEKSGAYVYRSTAANLASENASEPGESAESAEQLYEAQVAETVISEPGSGKHESRRRGRGNRKAGRGQQEAVQEERAAAEHGSHAHAQAEAHAEELREPAPEVASEPIFEQSEATWTESEAVATAPVTFGHERGNGNEGEGENEAEGNPPERRKTRAPRKTAAKRAKKSAPRTIADVPEIAAPAEVPAPAVSTEEAPAPAAAKKAARKTAARSRRPRKTAATSDAE